MDFYTILVYILTYIGLFTASFYIQNVIINRKENLSKKEYSTDKNVTILIPAYNEEKSIAKTIESIKSVDYPKNKLEIIVIDDGSKDSTHQIAKKYASTESPKIRVITKPNGGKGSALNVGIEEAVGEIIITMDADTFVQKDAVKRLMSHFHSEDIVSVTPAMAVYEPKTIWQRIQQIEYFLGVFLRKKFATINAIHVTPGAFSAYRKSFFEKHGGFDEKNITEDVEIALRIQSKELIIENEPEAVVYTIAPSKFSELMIQRKRWYTGIIKNIWAYKELFGPRRGAFGTIVLPLTIITIFTGIFFTGYTLIRTLDSLAENLDFLKAINFKFNNAIEINKYLIENVALKMLSDKIIITTALFIFFLALYLYYAKKQTLYKEGLKFNLLLFVAFFGILFSFWWLISFIYLILNKEIKWRKEKKEESIENGS